MRSFLIVLNLALFCSACSRGEYFITNAFRNGIPADVEIFTLDSTYHFYIRQVYKDKNALNENVLKTNLDGDTANKIRIETEYLLLSLQHRNAIYISTIPDKYQRYYAGMHNADTLINAYDFSTFHFGTIDENGESISFVSKKRKKILTWDIRPFLNGTKPEKLLVREISVERNDIVENVILLDKALEEPVSFTLQKNFSIIFHKPLKRREEERTSEHPVPRADRQLYFRPNDHSFNIYFRFNKNIENSRDSVIGFDNRRIRYFPPELLKNR
jgi:hypothetical protein